MIVKAIIFDCFGVLYQGSLDYLYEITPESRQQELRDVSHSSDFGYLTHDEYVQRVSEITGKTSVEIVRLIGMQHIRHDDMFRFVQSLKPRYRIGLLSNVGGRTIEQLFTSAELRTMFDATVFSSDVGMVKPYPEIYELMASRLGVATADCLMIDDRADNIEGAQAVGMQAIRYQSKAQVEAEISDLLSKETSHARTA